MLHCIKNVFAVAAKSHCHICRSAKKAPFHGNSQLFIDTDSLGCKISFLTSAAVLLRSYKVLLYTTPYKESLQKLS